MSTLRSSIKQSRAWPSHSELAHAPLLACTPSFIDGDVGDYRAQVAASLEATAKQQRSMTSLQAAVAELRARCEQLEDEAESQRSKVCGCSEGGGLCDIP